MSNTPGLQVKQTGLLSLIVDKGRFGFEHMGITNGGPADLYSCKWANQLVANDDIPSTIELLGPGAQFEAHQACTLAITGGVSQYRINNTLFSSWQSHQLTTGDVIEIVQSSHGLRSYLAVRGGFKVAPVFGSSSTVIRDKLGGLDGQGSPLNPSDKIEYSTHQSDNVLRSAPSGVRLEPAKQLTLRIVKGYQFSQFSSQIIAQLLSNRYTIGSDSSRMAARFDGPALKIEQSGLYSEGIAHGAVQIPPQGVPIVMLNDRQTIGGYPKVGSVLSLDCDLLSQASVGSQVRFEFIDMQQAHNILALAASKQKRLMAQISSE